MKRKQPKYFLYQEGVEYCYLDSGNEGGGIYHRYYDGTGQVFVLDYKDDYQKLRKIALNIYAGRIDEKDAIDALFRRGFGPLAPRLLRIAATLVKKHPQPRWGEVSWLTGALHDGCAEAVLAGITGYGGSWDKPGIILGEKHHKVYNQQGCWCYSTEITIEGISRAKALEKIVERLEKYQVETPGVLEIRTDHLTRRGVEYAQVNGFAQGCSLNLNNA